MNKRFLGMRVKEFLIAFSFYFFFAFFYYLILWLNNSGFDDDSNPLFDIVDFMDDAGLDYFLKALFTYPIWYLLFVRFKTWKQSTKIMLHLILMPSFVFVWIKSYYYISELVGFWHLKGMGSVWDIYIPALFYVLQFGVFHAYNYHLDNQRKIMLEGELRNAALKSELSALKAQLNPHFLYNVFNTISASVPAKNEKTRKMIAELSDLFRYQLKASQVEFVSVREELDFVLKYLELEKERFQERLKIDIDVDQSILDEMVPPMLLQPIVENSIKHGLSSLIEGGMIKISIQKKEDKLFFEISDTGVGIKNKSLVFDKGIGLTNTKLRLEKLYQSSLILSDNQPTGLIVSFEI